jgi:hypothetical protein
MSSNCIEQAGQNYIKWFYENNRVDKDNLPPTRGEFINKLLTDDEFYEKWGNNCCEEISRDERIQLFYQNECSGGKPMSEKILKNEIKSDRTLKMLNNLNVPKRKLKENGKS